jgi:hypothetical protein
MRRGKAPPEVKAARRFPAETARQAYFLLSPFPAGSLHGPAGLFFFAQSLETVSKP